LLEMFTEINNDGQTILMVTHSARAASHANRVMFIKDGEVFHEIYKAELSNEKMHRQISDAITMIMTGGDNVE